MRPVNVNKTDVLKRLRKNRKAHRAIFLEALEGYRKAAIAEFEKHIERVKKQPAGKNFRVYVSLTQPVDHTEDYDSAIGLLELSVDEVVSLDEDSYRQFYLDQWGWTASFVASNSYYSATAAKQVKDDD